VREIAYDANRLAALAFDYDIVCAGETGFRGAARFQFALPVQARPNPVSGARRSRRRRVDDVTLDGSTAYAVGEAIASIESGVRRAVPQVTS
jgi:hypothetical protein